jgi:hypothetical protein
MVASDLKIHLLVSPIKWLPEGIASDIGFGRIHILRRDGDSMIRDQE